MTAASDNVDEVVQVSFGVQALLLEVRYFEILTRYELAVAQVPELVAEAFVEREDALAVDEHPAVLWSGRRTNAKEITSSAWLVLLVVPARMLGRKREEKKCCRTDLLI